MPTTAKSPKKTGKRSTSALPAALAKRATAAAATKRARLLRAAREQLALIARRKKEITEAFYDIGVALGVLSRREMVEALGRKSFAEVCEKDAGISASTGTQLVEIATSMSREQALAMGQKKASAMIALAAATPAADTAASLFRTKRVALPGGKSVAPRAASANQVLAAATAIRQARTKSGADGAPRRGRTTTAEERTLAELLQRKLRKLGLDRAVVTAVATKPGQGADLRFEHIPAAKVDVLKKGIGA